MSNNFVEVGVEITGQRTELTRTIDFGLIPGKFLNGASFGAHFIVCVNNVTQGHRFGSVHFANPVRVREVDPNGGGWRSITGFLNNRDYFG